MEDSILELIGNTPLVRFRRLFADFPGEVAAKLEEFNPTGSVKVRVALGLIREAERTGALKRGGTIVESTSGNTGIGIALAGVILGYRVIIVVTDRVQKERVNIMKALGAEVIICPSDVDIDDERSYLSTVHRIAQEEGAYYLDQVDNPVNSLTHYRTTAVEIWEQTGGRITHFVAGIGTGGTITGVGRFLKEKNPSIKVIGVEPEGSIFRNAFYDWKHSSSRCAGGNATQAPTQQNVVHEKQSSMRDGTERKHLRPHNDSSDAVPASDSTETSKPRTEVRGRPPLPETEVYPSLVRGIGETDFIPQNVDFSVYDDVLQISDAEAFLMARRMVSEEGIVAGGSSGAAVAAALKIAPTLSDDDLMVVLIPDTGNLYLSTIYDDDWMREHGFIE